jgi:acyl-CoA thioesterase-1
MGPPRRIIAFGDSLTVGYQSPTPQSPGGTSTPYGRFLQELLGDGAEIWVSGVNGEFTGEMAMRLSREVIALQPDDVVLLGGANDLGYGAQPQAIMRNLVTMYERLRGAAIRPVAVTVPSIRGFDALIPPRQALNGLIADYCRSKPQPLINLFAATAEPDTLRLAEHYSNDGLHLTTDGYRLLAQLLYDQLFKAAASSID